MFSNTIAQMKKIIRFASYVPNEQDSQPRKFRKNINAFEITPDISRLLSVVILDNREIWISLGCALENLLLGAYASGYVINGIYLVKNVAIFDNLSKDTPGLSLLLIAILVRHNTRSENGDQPIYKDDLDTFQRFQVEPGVAIQFLTNLEEIKTVLKYVKQGNLIQYADTANVNKTIDGLHLDKREALRTHKGLISLCSGNPDVPHWLAKSYVSGTNRYQQAAFDVKRLRSSSGRVVITSDSDEKTGWVRTGQVYGCQALKILVLNIKSALLNQPRKVTNFRSQFQIAI